MIIFLSHVLDTQTRGYGGNLGFEIEVDRSISKGDRSNSALWTLSNHIGTHIDAPLHFSSQGMALDQFPASFWVFENPHLIDRPSRDGDLIGVEPWVERIPENCDLLLIRTGFERCRGQESYWSSNPGFRPELAEWIRSARPSIRALGFDCVSLSSYLHRDVGRAAHRSFLASPGNENPILVIEDMALAQLKASPRRVQVAPLRVFNSDGAPVTIFAEF